MPSKRGASGGKAEAAGSSYEAQVAAWYCVRVLLGASAQPLFDLPSTTTLQSIDCQTFEPVDDANLHTSEDGWVFVQAKRSVTLSAAKDAPLVSVIDQFVRQQKKWADGLADGTKKRALDPLKDRLVFATRSHRARKVTQVLARLLRGLRDKSNLQSLQDVQSSEEEREVANVIEAIVRDRWQAVYGRPATNQEVGALLRLMWVQTLDVEEGEGDQLHALDLMRANVLADPAQASSAFSELVKLCGRLRAERSGTDGPRLAQHLSGVGIKLRALPTYRADIEALRRWSVARLTRASRFTHLLESDPNSTIERVAWLPLQAAAKAQSLLVVGEPGSGKSGLFYRLAATLESDGVDLVFLPVDLLNVENFAELKSELGIEHSLAETLRNWPGENRGVIVVDALDAARKLETQAVLREALDEVLRDAGGRWNVVASVRKYDLRQGTEWRRMFRGRPPADAPFDPEFSGVAHIRVEPLADQEIEATATFSPELHALITAANPDLRQLLRNIFNLHLLAELVEDGVVGAELEAIRTQAQLLSTYWQHRIRRADGNHDAREAALRAVLSEMLDAKALRVERSDLSGKLDNAALVDLEKHDVLRTEGPAGGINEDTLLFSHHVLFDYAVARLIFKRGRDPAGLVSLLQKDRALTVMLGPSLNMALGDAWAASVDHQAFWTLAFALSEDQSLPATAALSAATTIAVSTTSVANLEPLLAAMRTAGPKQGVADRLAQHLVGALMVRMRAESPLVGPEAGPWMAFAQGLSEVGTSAAMFLLRPLLGVGLEAPDSLTPEQLTSGGAAARALLEFGLSFDPRPSGLIAVAIGAVGKSIASDVSASAAVLRKLIEPQHVKDFGYEELRWLAREIKRIAAHDPTLAVEIYEAAYGFEDRESETKTNFGSSGILSLTSTRRQDYQSAWYQLSEAIRSILASDPATGTRAVARGVAKYVARERSSPGGEEASVETFEFGSTIARYAPDDSYSWYRAGSRSPQDAPALVGKFDEFLRSLADDESGTTTFQIVLDVLTEEAGSAVLWASLLTLATEFPDRFAKPLAPLLRAAPILVGWDTQYQAGTFLGAAYGHLDANERRAIEEAIVALKGKGADNARKKLVGCIPIDLIATEEVRAVRQEMQDAGSVPGNAPPMRVTVSSRAYDTDAYLRDQGVDTSDPASAGIREAMRLVEEFPRVEENKGTSEIASERLGVIAALAAVLRATPLGNVPVTLREHAEGVMAEATAAVARFPNPVIADPSIRSRLKELLLLGAQSLNPHFDQAHEDGFHEQLSWGGPSARSSAAHGLMDLVRMDQEPDPELLRAIHDLARDPVCHVRLQVVQSLRTASDVDLEWAWSEIEYVLVNEGTRGVVGGALEALGFFMHKDVPRAVRAAGSVGSRFRGQAGAGIARVCEVAAGLIFDAYFFFGDPDAKSFYEAEVREVVANQHMLRSLVARYSDQIRIGSDADPSNPDHIVRARVLAFYNDVLDGAFQHIEALASQRDINEAGTWPSVELGELRAMFELLDEITLRLKFAADGREDPDDPVEGQSDQARFYREVRPLLVRLADVKVVHVAHYLIETLEALIPLDPPGVFALIAQSVRASEKWGYTTESLAADLVVKIVERYLADHREVFADSDRLNDLVDCLDAFVRAGWPAAQSLTFRLGEIWR